MNTAGAVRQCDRRYRNVEPKRFVRLLDRRAPAT